MFYIFKEVGRFHIREQTRIDQFLSDSGKDTYQFVRLRTSVCIFTWILLLANEFPAISRILILNEVGTCIFIIDWDYFTLWKVFLNERLIGTDTTRFT